ncbi:prenyltransferase/squalene oxidase repeat-containing protein [Fictibacillus fluitans]|uniref:Prenyltransferase/squalene oxidase repeat-containing protein n=1 Tax=Fictibacillus fluitans TaxID=3058422 RepID=A0ABT8HQX0_9BACL|nr:prenyltransferase/squalene oxidase repeat-containing protein [Fictibacillus sp. NE201]MDN4523169.1 prenyltransferase/squalene oxidase repeat-containing protein [Fictibacillus sp. NE201]
MQTFIGLKEGIDSRRNMLLSMQQEDGSFRFCFENPVTTDAYLLVLLVLFNWKDYHLKEVLVRRILSKQSSDGTWRVYPDEKKGNLSVTIEAYCALCYYGMDVHDKSMQQARSFILSEGGLNKANILTKAFLAMNGILPWPRLPFDPGLLIDLPAISPLQLFDLSSFARIHFVPMIAAMRNQFSILHPAKDHLSGLAPSRDNLGCWEEFEIPALIRFFTEHGLSSDSIDEKLEKYMLNRIEKDGTLLSYAISTVFMVYGLLALGYSMDSPVIQKAIYGITSLLCYNGQQYIVQNSPSAIWDTSLSLYALLESGMSPLDPRMQNGIHFLLKHQHTVKGDWQYHCPETAPGGWGFSESNSLHPDPDDTQAALRPLSVLSQYSGHVLHSWQKGINWLLAMQNDDGGWASFEKNTNKAWLGELPIDHAYDALIDASFPDMTGRILEFLGTCSPLTLNDASIQRAVSWLQQNQEADGSWRGRWGVCYLYGTWAAVTGMGAAGFSLHEDCHLQKAEKWIRDIQHEDGSWGESCSSDIHQTYTPLSYGTLVQTSWALDSLTCLHSVPTPEIEKAVRYLLHSQALPVTQPYPTGIGLPGYNYVIYYSYSHIYPLLALSHVYTKYVSHGGG